MAAFALGLGAKTRIGLLAGLHRHAQTASFFDLSAASVQVQAVGCVDPIAMIGHQPVDAVGVSAFLVRGESHNDVAAGHEALAPQANQCVDKLGHAALHVERPASIEEAIAFGQPEWVQTCGPSIFRRVDHVEMRNQQDRLGCTLPAQPHHQVLLVGAWAGERQIGIGEACDAQTRHHRLGRFGRSEGRRAVNLHQFLQQLPLECAISWIGVLVLLRQCAGGQQHDQGKDDCECLSHFCFSCEGVVMERRAGMVAAFTQNTSSS